MAVPLVISVALVLGILAGYRLLSVWVRYRGRRVVTCPENERPAGVTLDAGYAVATGLGKPPALRLDSCSRWPEKAGCGQQCLKQIEASPEGCLVRNILMNWYGGKDCVACGLPVDKFSPASAKPAVLCADGISVEWSEIPAEELQETLSAGKPLCFACHTARKMVREHSGLISGLSEATGRPVQ